VRIDPEAARYDEHWRPVLGPACARLLDLLADRMPERGSHVPAPRILDLGAGTGGLVIPAAQRWPDARFVGLDVSPGMLSFARRRAALARLDGHDRRLTWLEADAGSIPLDDGSVDIVMSSFALQMVRDRATVLREVSRVVRASGILAFVTWLEPHETMAADDEFDEAVADLGIDEPEDGPDDRDVDLESPESAVDELEAAGFVGIRAELGEVRHAWSRAAYLRFKEEYDERDLFSHLDRPTRDRLIERVRARWAPLSEDAFAFRHPTVTAMAMRPSA